MAKKYGQLAIRNRSLPHNESTVMTSLDLAAGDTAWSPDGTEIAGPCRVFYQFHDDGTPTGCMVMSDVPLAILA